MKDKRRKRSLPDMLLAVWKLASNRERDPDDVIKALEVIEGDENFVYRFGLKDWHQSEISQFASWVVFYRKIFGIELETEITVLPHAGNLDRLIVMAQGLSMKLILEKVAKMMPVFKYWDDRLISITSVRAPGMPYAIWARNCAEADREMALMSAQDLEKWGVNCMTLEEYLIFTMKFFHERGRHLDEENATICAGSRDNTGCIPWACWHEEFGLTVKHCGPDIPAESEPATHYLRARQVLARPRWA